MAYQKEGVNPLRPYYIPPTIGEEPLPSAPGPNAFATSGTAGASPYASKTRDIFSDIDYRDYISEPSSSAVQTVKDLVDGLLWKYTSALMAQPFDVAKTILQVRSQEEAPGLLNSAAPTPDLRRRESLYDNYPDSDSDPDEPAYFTSNVHNTPAPFYTRSERQRQRSTSPSSSSPPAPRPAPPAHQLVLRTPDSVLEVISQLWQKEGGRGVWKGANATFLYTVLSSLLENWSRSLLSALFNVPDLGVKDDLDRLIDIASPYPWASLFVAAAAAVTTGLILSPLDLIRTRLILTPTARSTRGSLTNLRRLPSYLCPSSLVVPTILHSLIHPILTLSTPLVLRTRFMIDREVSPVTFSITKFCSSTIALFIKLPLETVLRRGQAAVLTSPEYVRALEVDAPASLREKRSDGATMETIVPLGKFDGVFGTMRTIVYEEGTRATVPTTKNIRTGKPRIAEAVFRRGQGVDGLWRGWKVSWWGLVGLWTAGLVGGGGDGEF